MKPLIAILLGVPLLAFAAASSPDEHFYRSAAEAGIAEVDLGKLAEQKVVDPALKDFATRMVHDHSGANEKLKALAATKNIPLPEHASASAVATKGKLEVLKGESFDKSYIKSQVKAHEDTVALLQKEISSGQDADAKSFAQSVLPTVEAHLKAIRELASKEKVAQR